MAVYVDPLRPTPRSRRWPFPAGCHLAADTAGELHAFAGRLGLARRWFQDHPRHPHYDLTRARRLLAVRLGAVEVGAREMVALARARRAPAGREGAADA